MLEAGWQSRVKLLYLGGGGGGGGKARNCLQVTEDLEGVTTPALCTPTEKL